jgi:GrpB-like predicted nucleotidyltransferase (UPF0157 family)
MHSDTELHQMTPDELGRLFPIILETPSAEWSEVYRAESRRIREAFAESEIIRMDHIGSTAIPNLKAKPTIDMLLQVSQGVKDQKIIELFVSLGYQYINRPDNPPPHMMFVKGYTIKGFEGQTCHVHVRYQGDWDELYFRDYLISHPRRAKEYEELKLELAARYRNDREAYTNAKTPFVEKINQLARGES